MDQLTLRNKRKAKKPHFARQDSHKRVKLASGWRRPKGYHSKMRLGKRGYAPVVSNGWGSPASVAGLTKDGLRPVLVATPAQLAAVDAKRDAVIIARTLGAKKREGLLKQAKERKLRVLGVQVEKTLVKITTSIESRRKAKAERAAKQQKKAQKKTIEQKVETKAAPAPTTEAAADASADEEKSELEAEKRKVLNKRV